jgi:hypothetical protein
MEIIQKCLHAHNHTHVHMQIHAHTHTHAHARTHSHMHAGVDNSTQTNTHKHMHVNVGIHRHIFTKNASRACMFTHDCTRKSIGADLLFRHSWRSRRLRSRTSSAFLLSNTSSALRRPRATFMRARAVAGRRALARGDASVCRWPDLERFEEILALSRRRAWNSSRSAARSSMRASGSVWVSESVSPREKERAREGGRELCVCVNVFANVFVYCRMFAKRDAKIAPTPPSCKAPSIPDHHPLGIHWAGSKP